MRFLGGILLVLFAGAAMAGFSRQFFGPGACGGAPLFNLTFEPGVCYGIPWPGECDAAPACDEPQTLVSANLETLLGDCTNKNGSVRFDAGGNHLVFFLHNCTGPISSLTCIEFPVCGAERGEMMDFGLLPVGTAGSSASAGSLLSLLFA